MIITVQVFKLCPDKDEDEFEQEFFINDERAESRRKLARCAWWAARNGRSVTTFAKGADE